MKILIMPSWYENKNNEQAGAFFREQAEALQREGNQVTVLVAHIVNWPYFSEKQWFQIKEYYKNNIHVIYTNVPTFGCSSLSTCFFTMFTWHYMRLFKYYISNNDMPDILYAHSFWPAGYAALQIKERYKIPLVVQEHRSTILTMTIPKGSWKFLIKTINGSDAFWTVSKRLKELIEKKTKIYNVIQVMPNIVNPIFFSKEKKIIQKKKNVFLSVGNLIPIKKMDFLIEVFMKTKLKNSELWIAGDGPLRKKLQGQINNLGGEDRVKLLGKRNREEIAALMNKSDIFVMVSESETFGVVYIEALATGLPVIATRNGGADDIVNTDNGILISVNSKKELENALLYMERNYSKYDSQYISNKCRENYSASVIINKQLNIFRGLVRNNAKY